MEPELEVLESLGTVQDALAEIELEVVERADALWLHVTALRLFAGGAAIGGDDPVQRLHLRRSQRRRRVRAPVWIC